MNLFKIAAATPLLLLTGAQGMSEVEVAIEASETGAATFISA